MFNYISGTVAHIFGNTVVVDVHGIGYEILATTRTTNDLTVGQNAKLFTYLQVREDGVSLFGFATMEEKKMFLNLISVSGVGPKVAQSILSGMDSNSLAYAIYNGDTKLLTKIKGLGKKTAERLVLELKEKVMVDASQIETPIAKHLDSPLTKEMQNAIAVLCSLGKSQQDAEKLVDAASKLGATTAEDLINMAFRIN